MHVRPPVYPPPHPVCVPWPQYSPSPSPLGSRFTGTTPGPVRGQGALLVPTFRVMYLGKTIYFLILKRYEPGIQTYSGIGPWTSGKHLCNEIMMLPGPGKLMKPLSFQLRIQKQQLLWAGLRFQRPGFVGKWEPQAQRRGRGKGGSLTPLPGCGQSCPAAPARQAASVGGPLRALLAQHLLGDQPGFGVLAEVGHTHGWRSPQSKGQGQRP